MLSKLSTFLNLIKQITKINLSNLKNFLEYYYYINDKNYEKDFLNYFNKRNKKNFLLIEKMYTVYKSLEYIRINNFKGSIVEVGVYKGRMGHLICYYLDKYKMKNKVYFFDTFEGMTKKGKHDYNLVDRKKYSLNEGDTFYPLEKIKNDFKKYNSYKNINFIKGDVNKILNNKKILPIKISLLRLDTDFYLSTKNSLEKMYNLIQKSGVLIFDDFGHWNGEKKAAMDFFAKKKFKPFLLRTCRPERVVIKN